MNIVELIANYGVWSWVVLGLVLLALELVLPGGIFIWLGGAGILTGLVAALAPALAWPWQFLIFGVLALGGIVAWLRFRPRDLPTDRPYLNRRAESLVGQEALLEEAIAQGFGRVALGDTLWRVAGPDLAAGTRVRIVGHQGAVLRVEPA